MNHRIQTTAVILATATLGFGSAAFAQDDSGGDSEATLNKQISVNKDVDYTGEVEITGEIETEALGMAVIDGNQHLHGNDQMAHPEQFNDDEAKLGDDALKGAQGNIGINVAAGDTNAQANASAVATADADFVFGHGDAEVFIDQQATANESYYQGTSNAAVINGNALRDAQGNIGANIAAGSDNAQYNALALATGADSMSEAAVSTRQETADNHWLGDTPVGPDWSNHASLGRNALRDATGNIGANVAAGRNNLQSNSLAMSKIGE